DRWKRAQETGRPFEPELDLATLLDHHRESMARLAGRNTFVTGSGGLTKVQLMDKANPGLREAKDSAAQRVQNLRNRIDTAERQGGIAARDTRKIGGELTRVERRATPIIEDVGRLGREYGPELSYLSGQLRELGLRWRHLRAELITRGAKVRDIETRYADLTAELGGAADDLQGLRRAYSAAEPVVGDTVYQLNRRTYRYYPAAASRKIDGLLSTGADKNVIVRMFDELRAFVLNFDGSIATIQGSLGAMMDPITTYKVAGDMWRAARDPDSLNALARAEPELMQDFAFHAGFDISAGAARGIEYMQPKAIHDAIDSAVSRIARREFRPAAAFDSKVNESLWRGVMYRAYQQWKVDRAWAMARGDSADVAGRQAAESVFMVIPRLNPRRSGQTPGRQAAERAAIISPSFTKAPALMLRDATSALVKLGLAQTGNAGAIGELTSRELLALRKTLWLGGSVMSISAMSALASAQSNGLTSQEALAEVMDPRSGRFASIVIGNQGTLSIGGPMRSFLRAFAPRRTQTGGWDWPQAGLVGWVKGRRSPAAGQIWDQFAGEDFFGEPVTEGVFASKLANRLYYFAENSVPIWIGGVMEGARVGDVAGLGSAASQATLDALGFNAYPRRASEEFDRISRARYGADFFEASRSEQQKMRKDFPRLWSRVVEQGNERRQEAEVVREQIQQRQLSDDAALVGGQLDRSEWLDNYRERLTELRARVGQIYDPSGAGGVPFEKPRNAFERYINVIAENEGANGAIDAAGWQRIDEWRDQQSREDRAYIDENTGVGRTPMGRVYRAVSQVQGRLYDLPKYRGFTPDEAREIDDLWQRVRNEAPDAERANMLRAYQKVIGRASTKAEQGVLRRITGSLRQTEHRERYRAQHPELRLFFGEGTLTDREAEVLRRVVAREAAR
ncbi:MAG: hypothetical protein NUW01_06005, partial [Gemmatimonadaceae bacterium]|nr:hypothetical protein [Gemmatimonadaceae bacterium]